MTCGSSTTFKNATFDLSEHRNIYYLNPLDLLSASSIPFAKSICLPSCPSISAVCNSSSLPCTSGQTYRCPYYKFATDSLYGKLPGVPDYGVQWFDNMANMTGTNSDLSAAFLISRLQGSNQGWANTLLSSYNITASSSVSGRYYQLRSQLPGSGPCYPVWAETVEYFHRCFPVIPDAWGSSAVSSVTGAVVGGSSSSAFKDSYNNLSQRWTRYVADISKGILIIVVAGLVGGVVLSLLWLLILRFLAGLMAWLTILAVNVALAGLTLYSFALSGDLGKIALAQDAMNKLPPASSPIELEQTQWRYIGIGIGVVAALILLLTLLMISRVRIAVACIKVASQAIGAMPSIMFFPLLPFVFEVGLVIYWIAVTALLYSAGDLSAHCRPPSAGNSTSFSFTSMGNITASSLAPTAPSAANTTCYANVTSRDDMVSACAADPDCRLSYDWNNELQYAFLYHFFGLLWTNQFIIGATHVTVAGAIASYYFAHGDSMNMPALPVLTALKNTVVYHLGSVAFGSIIIAIIQLIRFILDYLDRKTKELQCIMWCLEKIVAFINRNAYIMVAVKGTSYCVSAGRAVSLIVTNVLRIAAVNFIGSILIFLGKVAVAATCGIIAFAMSQVPYYTDSNAYPDTTLSSPILPIAISIITGFAVAELFFSVYEMAIDTIMLAFCEDCESNGNPKYAPPLLMEIMGSDASAQGAGNGKHSETAKPIGH
ncbi:hypothetical protein QJQ45_008201 [Haematococcus lacustris]|nr:hypothetical protein QJQ45_008201 [Haematococcus lacustris]